MAIVTSVPDQDGKVSLYDIPDSDLANYAIPADKAAQMFPKKDSPTRDDAVATVKPKTEGDVQAYAYDVCYYWWCSGGYCWWEWWYC